MQGSTFIDHYLQKAGFGTLVMDLLTEEESPGYGKGLDVDVLTRRLTAVTQWMLGRDLLNRYRLGYFGAHTGGAAAIEAAAVFGDRIGAIVCGSGRLELVAGAIRNVQAPTLLIAGGLDRYVVEVNRAALDSLPGNGELEVIEGATNLFEGEAVGAVVSLAVAWFAAHLGQATAKDEMSLSHTG